MCTVSFVYANDSFLLTSNRDEKITRPLAIEPKVYQLENKKIIYPKDAKAGGTWFVIDEFGNAIILLNGGKTKHIPKEKYRMSRGIVVLDLIASNSIISNWKTIDLTDIEPFTLVVLDNKQPFQLQWSGEEKSTDELEINQTYIWSSSTLYAPEIQQQRADWFAQYMNENKEISAEKMKFFHKNTEPKDSKNGLIINRDNLLKTLSVTQAIISGNSVFVNHSDLIQDKEYAITF
ncbi:NRDE family protein [Flavobacterium terrigena]|uniref:Transport and Golgi organisation 2 n=1 Tax=Flavobacterium terrigena TaxID=402734 RepID=A0A1H6WDX6_9FLAO|nr:NRDE family protein [Flavobacterium terrigena]SEJ11020.1 Transport and Golgi organisation 2 [Flavobacterium terrigena]